MGRIAIVGDALLDVFVTPDAPIDRGRDVPARIRIGPGGQGANLAVRLARSGVDVVLVCALADDTAGRIVRTALASDRVEIVAVPAEATGTVVVIGDVSGERSMLSQRVSFAERAAEALPADASWLVVSGYLLLEPAARRLAEAAAASGARCVLVGCAVPGPVQGAWRAAASALDPELVVANRDEIDRIGMAAQVDAMAVTDAGGATVSIGGVAASARTPAGAPAVDTTGAGDAFAAGLVAGLLDAPWPPTQRSLQAAVDGAVTLAAEVARVTGAHALVPGERPASVGR